jgi:1,4-dihydroxy-2-naphthoate octaprenyltransferase
MSATNWVLAARPATLWAGVAPVVVGTAIAIDDGVFRIPILAAAVITAVAVQVGVNFANDVADAVRGADTADRLGPTRAVSVGLISPHSMWVGVGIAFAVAAAAGGYLAIVAGPFVLLIGAVSFLAALGYTNGPLPYGYRGLGEVFVFIFFGFVATVGTRFVYDGTSPARAWVVGAVMGLLASAILIANNVRDLDTDRASGKRTLAVLMGRPATKILYTTVVSAAFAVITVAVLFGALPSETMVVLLALPLAIRPIVIVTSTDSGPALIKALKDTARLQIAVAALLGAGLLA